MLNSSGSWSVHISSINVIFYDGLSCLVLRMASSLDAFRTYPSVRSCPACFVTTGTPEAPEHRSSRTRCSFHSDNNAPSRYHTNCLTYIIPCLFICIGVDYTFTLSYIINFQKQILQFQLPYMHHYRIVY